eukprot:NODE_2426_length_700_cov_31.227343_g1976_i0.p1 GENE.NODE_2426_length_700_cov_31.227343_g1976_i0~~NODE_2426_length_700_cov_31.227343_g1976_i0.p1  ORF type:complete len:89 (-),score=26.80 NODE_2426_length_700_cov_31.227343_g1976_i0:281-547(-)
MTIPKFQTLCVNRASDTPTATTTSITSTTLTSVASMNNHAIPPLYMCISTNITTVHPPTSTTTVVVTDAMATCTTYDMPLSSHHHASM